jgi:hypothetical protein
MDLQGLEDNADFWNVDIDEFDEKNVTFKDLTKSETRD